MGCPNRATASSSASSQAILPAERPAPDSRKYHTSDIRSQRCKVELSKVVGGAAHESFVQQSFNVPGPHDNNVLGVLELTFNDEEWLLRDYQAQLFKKRRSHNRVADTGFILQADKNETLGCAR